MRKQPSGDEKKELEIQKSVETSDDIVVEKKPEPIKGIVKLVSPEYVIVEINGNNQHIERSKFGTKIPVIGETVKI